MDTFKIKAVISASEKKSLSKAAEDYCYTPSAFSHMLTSFEKELGIKLFHRTNTGVILTKEGEQLMPRFKELIESERKLDDELVGLREGRQGQLRIGTYSSISRGFLSGIIREFSAANPDVKLYISVVDSLNGWLDADKADIIFADGYEKGENEWICLFHDECSAVAPPGLFPEGAVVTREELYSHPHILLKFGCLDGYFDESRFEKIIHLTSEDDLSVINMVREGLGTTVLSDLIIEGNLDGVSVHPMEPRVTREIGFAYKKQVRRSSPILQSFIKFVKSYFARNSTTGRNVN